MRFLARTGGGLGDVAVMVAAFHAIVRNGHTVEVIVREDLAGVLADCDFITALHIKPLKRGKLSLYRELFGREWDAVVNLRRRGGIAFNLLGKLSGSKHLKTARDMDESLLETSYVLYHLSVLDGIIDDWRDPVETAVPFASHRLAEACEVAGITQGESYLTVAPGSGEAHKCWPPEKFGEVVKTVRDRYNHVLVVGSPRELGLCQGLADDCDAKCLAGKLGLTQTCALVSGATQHLGNDSGLGHVAAANGTSVLAVGGEKKFRPWQQKMLTGSLSSITPAMVVAELDG